jgi:hypothetical protein
MQDRNEALDKALNLTADRRASDARFADFRLASRQEGGLERRQHLNPRRQVDHNICAELLISQPITRIRAAEVPRAAPHCV